MDINYIQKQIAVIEKKLDMIKVKHYNDANYNYKFSNGKNEIFVSFITQDGDYDSIKNDGKKRLYLILSEAVTKKPENCVTERDIDELIKMKETTKKDVFDKIVDYVFFDKTNNNLFSIINIINEKEQTYEDETVNTKSDVADKKEDITKRIIEILNREFNNCGGFNINKKYYIIKKE